MNFYVEFSKSIPVSDEEAEWLKRAIPLARRRAQDRDEYLPDIELLQEDDGQWKLAVAGSEGTGDLRYYAQLFMQKFRPGETVAVICIVTADRIYENSLDGYVEFYGARSDAIALSDIAEAVERNDQQALNAIKAVIEGAKNESYQDCHD